MTTLISRQERVDFYNTLNELTRLLASMDGEEYRTGEHVEMARLINRLRDNFKTFTTIQEDILITDEKSGFTRVDNSFSHLFDDCEQGHGLYVSDWCPQCDNEAEGHREELPDPFEENREELAREHLDAVKALRGAGA